MFIQSYLDNAAKIIAGYNGGEPLATFLKKTFAAQKKFGSRDRKQIGHLCYCYYRLGKAAPDVPLQERLLIALFLCSDAPQPILEALRPEWNTAIAKSASEKKALLPQEYRFDAADVFPFSTLLSAEINSLDYAFSFLAQPDTYLRIRPGKSEKVLQQLEAAGIGYSVFSKGCIAVAPSAKLDEHLMLNRDAVVQDKSSQQSLDLLEPLLQKSNLTFDTWDCCAASGGKSILLHDLYPAARLTVSDIRSSILVNLRRRFAEAGIKDYKWFIGDVSDVYFNHQRLYDVIICDAPCSGSGTWQRTPEQSYFFTEEKLAHYIQLQRRIALNAAKQLKKGGIFIYITCSVFRAENEALVEDLPSQCGMQLQGLKYYKGYGEKADTLFAASFIKL